MDKTKKMVIKLIVRTILNLINIALVAVLVTLAYSLVIQPHFQTPSFSYLDFLYGGVFIHLLGYFLPEYDE